MKTNPNIIFISIDTLRADHVSCYGYDRPTTPFLDSFAEQSILFRNAFSTAVWTPPAHASMFTGIYPSQHGVVDEASLNDRIPTIAETLEQNGYDTAGFINNSQVGELVGLRRGHNTFHEVWKGVPSKTMVDRGLRFLYRRTRELAGGRDLGGQRTNQLALEGLRGRQSDTRPFYLFLHYLEPHNPLYRHRGHTEKFMADVPRTVDRAKIADVLNNPLICLSDDLELSDAEKAYLTGYYDGCISYQDALIRELFDEVKALGAFDDTLVVITADHGEHLGEHGLYSHVASLYEPVVHIPMFVKFPRELGVEPAESDALVQHLDIFPTILASAGIESPVSDTLGGSSLIPEAGKVNGHELVFSEWEGRIPFYVRHRLDQRDGRGPGHDVLHQLEQG